MKRTSKKRPVKALIISVLSAIIVAAALLGFVIIYFFEPNDPPVNETLSVIVRCLLFPVGHLCFFIENQVNRFRIPGPWSGLLMLAGMLVSAVAWSSLIVLVGCFWRRIRAKHHNA